MGYPRRAEVDPHRDGSVADGPAPVGPGWSVARLAMVALATSVLASVPATAPGRPPEREAPGWPRSAAVGQLLAHPDGGVVAVARDNMPATTLQAVLPTGALRWVATPRPYPRDETPALISLRRNGEYGPIQDHQSAATVGLDGAVHLDACRGDVLDDGLCVTVARVEAYGPARESGTVVTGQLPGGHRLWSTFQPGPGPDDVDVSATKIDTQGRAYVMLSASGPLLALDARTGAELWRRESGPGFEHLVVAAPDGVVLANSGFGPPTLTLVDGGGGTRWERSLLPYANPEGQVSVDSAIVDAARGRLAVTLTAWNRPSRAIGVSLAGGDVAWSTGPGSSARVLSVGPKGTLLAVDTGSRHEARAVDTDGRTRWAWASPAPVAGAVATSTRDVYVAQMAVWSGWGSTGLLHRIVPGRLPVPRRPQVAYAKRPASTPECDFTRCPVGRRHGIWLRIRTPATARVTFSRRRGKRGDDVVSTVPAGTHVVRVDPGCTPRPLRVTLRGPRVRYTRAFTLSNVGLGHPCGALP